MDISYKQKAKAMFTPVCTNLMKNWEVHLLLCVFIDKYNNLFYILSVKPINLYSKLLNPICLSGGGSNVPGQISEHWPKVIDVYVCVLFPFAWCKLRVKGTLYS